MRHFKRICLAWLCLVICPAWCLAQTEAKPTSPSTLATQQQEVQHTGPQTMRLDPDTLFPPGGPPYSLFSPFEFYARPNVALSTGRGPLAGILDAGVGSDFGIRSLLYNDDHNAAWYGDLGVGYLYNNSKDASRNIIVRDGTTTVTRFGTPQRLDSVTSLGVIALHRVDARMALGREYYFESNWLDGMRYSIGGDIGGVWGEATVKTQVNDRNIPGLQAGDVIAYNPGEGHSSGVTKGFFLGSSFNVLIPRRTHDFVIGTRVEWQQEYFNKLVDNNDGASQLKLMLEIGWRY